MADQDPAAREALLSESGARNQSEFRSKIGSTFSKIRAKFKTCNIGFRTLRRIAVAVLVVTFLVILTVLSVRNLKRKRAEALESDFPDYTNPRDHRMSRKDLSSSLDFPFEVGCRVPDASGPRANASFVMLARNSELDDVVSSMNSMERHFNQWFNYPWVFLNDVEFDETFKLTVKEHTNAEVEFGVVPKKDWDFPANVSEELLHEVIESQGDRKIMYGNMPSYHKMCRFYSGYFFHHPLVTKRDWYWRVEPDVQFFCDLTYDPFVEMQKHNKKYGFTVTIHELYYTVPSLFLETKAFIKEKGLEVADSWDILVKKFKTVRGKNRADYINVEDSDQLGRKIEQNLNLKKFLAVKKKQNRHLEGIKDFKHVRNIFEDAYKKPRLYEDKFDDEEYNLCHFWTNFEIARTDLFTSDLYQDYFNHLEASGGFYRERWGDAPVHSLAVAMMLPKEQLHYFRDVGYKHTTLGHCPNNAPGKQLQYEPSSNFVDRSEPKKWYNVFQKDKPDAPVKNGVGCRCVCPYKHKDLEDYNSVCIKNYAHVVSNDYKTTKPLNLDTKEKFIDQKIERYLRRGGQLGRASVQGNNA